jgi:uncharacterized repeat protein (TIGR03803 family)
MAGLLAFVSSRSRKTSNAEGLSGWKTASAVVLLCAATAIASPANTFKTLVNFDGTNGATPVYTSLVQGRDGDFYGTTLGGGANGAGTVFKITSAGTVTILYSFCSQANCADGSGPYAGLVQARDGNFYGTTYQGGASGIFGTVFKITPGGAFTTLHSFNLADGAGPFAALVQATSGNFYGTTSGGGPSNDGTVFKISPSGTLTTLHTFDGSDGAQPFAALVQATNGDFYGTTPYGGGYGTVFRITPSGTLTTLHSFNLTDGSYPNGLIQATDGNFYGTTYGGGTLNICSGNGCGTVFKITPQGTLTTLHDCDSVDGTNPVAVLDQGSDGNFYGTTYAGGNRGSWGTVFEVTPSGTLATLHSFGLTDGAQPYGPVAQATSGIFYGTATNGGANNEGTLFSLAVGLGPFVETQPASGKVGARVIILGTDLTGTTSVSFHGKPATFTIVSKSEITTTVPAGATTGKVKIVTPNKTLLSNVPFRVKP